jgi:hypothetical protein
MKSNSDVRPLILLDLGDGSWHYNYTIVEVPAQTDDGNDRVVFNYDTVHIWGNPDYATIVNAVIAERYSPSQETSLINKYNAFVAKLSNDSSDKDKYEAYLKEVAEIKAMVKEDLRGLGLMEPEPARTLEQAVAGKIAEIDAYDNSEAVNSFLIGETPCWITSAERSTYNTSITAAEQLGETEIELPLAGNIIPLPVQTAKMMLAMIQRYADKAAIVTAKHKAAVMSLETIEAVDSYDYTAGYPDKVTIQIPTA